MKRLYSLKKSRHIMKSGYDWYKKRGQTLAAPVLARFEEDLQNLDQALLNGDRVTADVLAKKLEQFCRENFKKSVLQYAWELACALVFALIIASVVRTVWFEPYEIPTGSMRPTFKEQDHLTVTKLAFGINVPMRTEHFYFDPNLVQRTSVFIFSGDKMPFIDQETSYFGILPYKKRYIKRLMGKPGDSLFFYGGQIYGVDAEGKPIPEFLNSPWLKGLEHIPYRTFEGEISSPASRQVVFNQMHKEIGRLSFSLAGEGTGEIFNGKEWIKDRPEAQKKPHASIETYSDFWGMRNYAMARLLTKEQLKNDPSIDLKDIGEGVLYLELRHTPSLNNQSSYTRGSPLIAPFTTVIPLQKEHLDAILGNMYTGRFVVENGRARRYSVDNGQFSANSPRFPGVPDGTYEFYFGKAVKVGWGAITYDLPPDHPLYKHDPANIQKLYNLGIEMDTIAAPHTPQRVYPSRYAYFRNGDLYLMGAPVLKKEDPALVAFNKREQEKEAKADSKHPYVAFRDYGPPLKDDGSYDIDFIRAFGVAIPDRNYLALGDNHAMSSDSRVFGFVPDDNIQGAPSIIVWPPGDRIGHPEQKPYPTFTLPRLIVWGIVLLIALIWYLLHRYNIKQPIFKKLYGQAKV